MTIEDEPRRQRVYYLRPEFVIAVLNWANEPDGFCIELCKEAELPKDAVAVSVFEDASRRAIGVIFEHESFDPVEPSHRLPEHGGLCTVSRVVVKGDDEYPRRPNETVTVAKKFMWTCPACRKENGGYTAPEGDVECPQCRVRFHVGIADMAPSQ